MLVTAIVAIGMASALAAQAADRVVQIQVPPPRANGRGACG